MSQSDFIRAIQLESCRRKFWQFCNTLNPDFYKPDRKHLIKLCDTLEAFYFGKLLKDDGEPYLKLMIRLPPQVGKSRTLVNFTKWVLGLNQQERIITASHTDSQATDFSRYTRDGIQEIKNLPEQIVYSDIFPDTKIKQGDSAVQKWALRGQHFNYLGVGVAGAVTGKGATLRIIDDIIKDAQQALMETALEKIWIWLSGTFSSRSSAEKGEVKEIFCATLWGEKDPQAILEETEGDDWYILSMPIYNAEKDEMLCDDLMSKKAFLKLKKRMLIDSQTKMIFHANYMCEAIGDSEQKVFPIDSIKTYKSIPTEIIEDKEVNQGWEFAYIDTADEGQDNFSMPIFQVVGNYVYLKDAIFDQENLTIQLSQVASKIKEYKHFVRIVVETNAAGAFFKRTLQLNHPEIEFYGQWSKANKMNRILSYSGLVNLYFLFPENPNPTTERFMMQVFKLRKTSTKEDDAPDSLVGAAAHLERYYSLFKE